MYSYSNQAAHKWKMRDSQEPDRGKCGFGLFPVYINCGSLSLPSYSSSLTLTLTNNQQLTHSLPLTLTLTLSQFQFLVQLQLHIHIRVTTAATTTCFLKHSWSYIVWRVHVSDMASLECRPTETETETYQRNIVT